MSTPPKLRGPGLTPGLSDTFEGPTGTFEQPTDAFEQPADEMELPSTPLASVCPDTPEATADDLTARLLMERVRRLLQHQALRCHWTPELLEDAVGDVVTLLLERRTPEVWEAFRHDEFETVEYIGAKEVLLKAIKQVVDRIRTGHKIEVASNSTYYRPKEGTDPPKRQRRILDPDRHLGDYDQWLTDRREEGRRRDLRLDMAGAISHLPSLSRRIVIRRVVRHQSWGQIAKAQNISIPRTKEIFSTAMAELAQLLHAYRDDAPGPRLHEGDARWPSD
jgi:DNA-directed RNA polymerase specialized sigma24 family protein